MRKLIGILLCSVAPGWLVLVGLEQRLLKSGVLNTKDLPPFVGQDSGTVSEYLLNVWHWDGALLILMIAALPSLALGVMLLRNRGAISRGFPVANTSDGGTAAG
jgi:hypothetical protein